MTRYRFIHANRAEYGVRRCCRAVGVSPASFHDWHRRGPSARQRADQRLLAEIGRIYRESGGADGAPRIHAELGDRLRGALWPQAGRAVAALGRAGRLSSPASPPAGLDPPRPGGRAGTGPVPAPVQPTPAQPAVACRLHRTELPTDQGTLYLVAVVDGCSRLAVGHAIGEHATAELAAGGSGLWGCQKWP